MAVPSFQNYGTLEIRAYMSPQNPNTSGAAERVGMEYDRIKARQPLGDKAKVYSITNSMARYLSLD